MESRLAIVADYVRSVLNNPALRAAPPSQSQLLLGEMQKLVTLVQKDLEQRHVQPAPPAVQTTQSPPPATPTVAAPAFTLKIDTIPEVIGTVAFLNAKIPEIFGLADALTSSGLATVDEDDNTYQVSDALQNVTESAQLPALQTTVAQVFQIAYDNAPDQAAFIQSYTKATQSWLDVFKSFLPSFLRGGALFDYNSLPKAFKSALNAIMAQLYRTPAAPLPQQARQQAPAPAAPAAESKGSQQAYIAKLRAERDNAKQAIQARLAEIERLKKTISATTAQLNAKGRHEANLQETIQQHLAEIEALKSRVNTLTFYIQEAKQTIKTRSTELDTCNRQVVEKNNALKEEQMGAFLAKEEAERLQQKINSLTALGNEAKQGIDTRNREIQRLQTELAQKTKQTDQKSYELRQQIRNHLADISTLNKTLRRVDTQLETCNDESARLRQEHDKCSAENAQLRQKTQQQETQLQDALARCTVRELQPVASFRAVAATPGASPVPAVAVQPQPVQLSQADIQKVVQQAATQPEAVPLPDADMLNFLQQALALSGEPVAAIAAAATPQAAAESVKDQNARLLQGALRRAAARKKKGAATQPPSRATIAPPALISTSTAPMAAAPSLPVFTAPVAPRRMPPPFVPTLMPPPAPFQWVVPPTPPVEPVTQPPPSPPLFELPPPLPIASPPMAPPPPLPVSKPKAKAPPGAARKFGRYRPSKPVPAQVPPPPPPPPAPPAPPALPAKTFNVQQPALPSGSQLLSSIREGPPGRVVPPPVRPGQPATVGEYLTQRAAAAPATPATPQVQPAGVQPLPPRRDFELPPTPVYSRAPTPAWSESSTPGYDAQHPPPPPPRD